MKYTIGLVLLLGLLSACSPKVGSEAWCDELKQKDKGEWTVNEARDFARHCLFN